MSDPPSTGPPIRADNLNYLRKKAKSLLRRARRGNADALARFAATGRAVSLCIAQYVIAREAGFASWPKLLDEFRFRDLVRQRHRLGSSLPLEPGEKMSTNQTLKLGPIDQIALTCTDLDAAQKFYCDILGLRLNGRPRFANALLSNLLPRYAGGGLRWGFATDASGCKFRGDLKNPHPALPRRTGGGEIFLRGWMLPNRGRLFS